MFLLIPETEFNGRELVNMDAVKKLEVEFSRTTFSEPGQPEEKIDFGYLRAEFMDGKEGKTLATYTDTDKAEAELNKITEALIIGANVFELTEDPDIYPKMDRLGELEAAALEEG